jgi:hypothetical protein
MKDIKPILEPMGAMKKKYCFGNTEEAEVKVISSPQWPKNT